MFEIIGTKIFWLTAAIAAIYAYLRYYVYNYWQRNKIPCEAPLIPFGNIPPSYFFGRTCIGNIFRESYEKFKQYPFHGFYAFQRPVIVISDPDIIREILVKSFSKFIDRGWFINEKVDPLSGHLFLLTGDKWKTLRGKLSPIFTSGKLKQMYHLLMEVSNEMINTCDADLKKSDVLEVKDIISRFTTDTISSIVYGFNCNSLKKPETEFRHYGIKGLEFGRLTSLLAMFIPGILEKLAANMNDRKVQNFFINIFNDMVNYRRKEKIVRKDFFNLLLQLLDHGEIEADDAESNVSNEVNKEKAGKLNIKEAAAQAFVFFIAGFETTSSTSTYCLYELALNPDVQEELQKEIDSVADGPGFTYDSILEMQYLDMVFQEALRKHTSVPVLNRLCAEDFPIPNSNFTIPKGMRVLIPTSGLHNDPKYYPDPEKFDPMRFSKENVTSRNNYVFLGFGEGPRNCIGKRFGLLQSKMALVAMLRNYTFSTCEQTQIPVKYSPDTFVQSPEQGIYLRAKRRLPTS